MKLAAAALSLALIVPGLAQSQTLAPPRLLYPGESPPSVPPPTPTPGSWPAADGSDVGLNHPDCPIKNPPLYTGPTTINTNNTTIRDVRITGKLTINADNVSIICVDLTSGSNYGIHLKPSADGTLISKSKIHDINTDGTKQGKGIYIESATHTTVEWSDFYHAEDLIHSEGDDTIIQHNWMHDIWWSNTVDLHADPIAIAAGTNVLIQNNRLAPFPAPIVVSSTIMVQTASGGSPPSCSSMGNVDIIDNYIDGDGTGNTVLNDHTPGCSCAAGMDFLNNQYGPNSTPFSYGSGDKACPPLTSRGGSCSGNKLYNGSPAGC